MCVIPEFLHNILKYDIKNNQYMENKDLSVFVDKILDDHNGVQIDTMFNHEEPNEDLKCTFISFLISKCIIRYAPGYSSGSNIYKFSKPGRDIMKDNAKRIAFIEEFMKFYNT